MIRLGYPTQNLTIPAGTNRTCRLASLEDEDKVRELVRENLAGLKTILQWNAEHEVSLFRVGQALIPFASHPAFPYDWAEEHGEELASAGELARTLGIRLSMHPGQYIQPGSLKPDVVERSLAELRAGSRILDLIGSPDSVLVLHMGGKHEDKAATAERFVQVMRSEEDALRYLALENDERVWTVEDIAGTARSLGIPAITDNLHHRLNAGGLTLGEALDLSLPTWEVRGEDPGGQRPKLHLSSQNPEKQAGAHAYSIEEEDWEELKEALDGRDADIMVEAKGKEHALLPLGIEIEDLEVRRDG